MKTINSSDLECLCFDSEDGVADWDLRPHPRIWGCNPLALPTALQHCPDQRRFQFVLLAAHLLWPSDTPPWAKEWLIQETPGLLGVELAVLERARWRLVPVPVAAGNRSRLHDVLVGVGTEVPDFSAWNLTSLANDSAHALEQVRRLVRLYGNQDSCFLFSPSTTPHALIEGESLGLPCYLGAMAAADNLPFASILATGRLAEDGRVLPVSCLCQKLDAAKEDVTLFLYPYGCVAPETFETECEAVTHVCEAVAAMACFQPGLALKIVHAERTLNSGRGIARDLCSFHSEMVGWIRRNRERITRALRDDPNLEGLVSQLQCWTDSTQRLDIDLGNAVLECLPVECVQNRATMKACTAWNICSLQMAKANHSGDLVSLQLWTDMAETLRHHINGHDDCGRMLTLHYVQKVIGEKHNRYAFSDSVEDEGAAEEVRELELAHERRRTRRGPCSNAVLGKYYGTLGQHHGFLGPEFLNQTLAFLNKAIECFCDSDGRDEQDRDRLYQVFALSSASRADEADAILRKLNGLWHGGAWNVNAMNPYQLHALLRLHVDSGRIMDSGLWFEIRDAWLKKMHGHPDQLISYNLGLLAQNQDLAVEMLHRSLDCCFGPKSGPTIQVMALLPLARLHEIKTNTVDPDLVNTAMGPIRSGDISRDHFCALLDPLNWADLLRCVAARRGELFPFSYR